MTNRIKLLTLAGALLLSAVIPLKLTAEAALPPDVTAMLTLKVLTFDRNLASRAGSEIVIGILYKAEDKAYADSMQKAFGAFSDKKVNGLPIKTAMHQFSDVAALSGWMGSQKATAVFLSPGLLGDAAAIHGAAVGHKCLTVGGSGDFPQKGAALGFTTEDNKPKIVIHRQRSKEEGVDFSADLLQIAKVL